jgi:hypothetical protein
LFWAYATDASLLSAGVNILIRRKECTEAALLGWMILGTLVLNFAFRKLANQ